MTLILGPRPDLFAEAYTVDDVELELFVDNVLLDFLGNLVPHFIFAVGAVEQEGSAFLGVDEDVVFLQKGEVVAGHEVGFVDQVRVT